MHAGVRSVRKACERQAVALRQDFLAKQPRSVGNDLIFTHQGSPKSVRSPWQHLHPRSTSQGFSSSPTRTPLSLPPSSRLLTTQANADVRSVYSSYEHSLLPTASIPSPPSSFLPAALDPKINLPLDITLEILLSTLLLCVGVVLSSRDLKPIQWNVWAGRLERSKAAREWQGVGQGGGNPYAGLEERPGFWDVRSSRQEFVGWMKGVGEGVKKGE